MTQVFVKEHLVYDVQNQRTRVSFFGAPFPKPFTQIGRYDLGLLYEYITVDGKPQDCEVINITGKVTPFFMFPANASFNGTRDVQGVSCNWCVWHTVCSYLCMAALSVTVGWSWYWYCLVPAGRSGLQATCMSSVHAPRRQRQCCWRS